MGLRPVLFILGLLVSGLAVLMLVPTAVGLYTPRDGAWMAFALSALLVGALGGVLSLANRRWPIRLSLRQGFLLTVAAWTVLSLLAAVPLLFPPLGLRLVDAAFEGVSGFTTTGATVLRGLEDMPAAVLVWRSLLQWIGGIGIVGMSVVVLPLLRVGGMQLFRGETSDNSGKAMPRVNALLGYMLTTYVVLTAVCAFAYAAAGMTGFEAINHAMTTVSTGGFSTRDGSLGAFGNPAVHYVAVPFMLAGALPFALYLRMVGRKSFALARNVQVQAFLGLAISVAAALVLHRALDGGIDWEPAFRHGLVNVISVITTTGFHTADYNAWGPFAVGLFFGLTFVGGCAGSTAGGIKIFRFQVACLAVWRQLHQLFQPSGVYPLVYGRRLLPNDVVYGVGGFFLLFALTMAALASGLAAVGCDFETSVTGAASALANVGPGLGDVIGPGGSYRLLPDAAKLLLAVGMLSGRLELFTLFVLLTVRFYRY